MGDATLPTDQPPAWLVVSPSEPARADLERRVSSLGYIACAASAPAAALALLSDRPFSGVVIEIDGSDSLELARRLAADWPDVGVVVVTNAPSGVEAARSAVPDGDALARPFGDEEFRRCLATLTTVAAPAGAPPAGPIVGELLGDSKPMHQVHDLLRRAAPG